MSIKVALAGQPNCGKSTIFNMVSGIRQHIANYPGVTVDKKSGYFSVGDIDIEMVDLPGTYSFSSYSLEEKVAKEFIINESPDIILNIVDASNLKRNLYLTFQLLEVGVPVVIVLNMSDVANRRGIIIDAKKMSEFLGCPVIEASAAKGQGKDEILEILRKTSELKENYQEFRANYDELEEYILELENEVNLEDKTAISKRWLCIKALEKDQTILEILKSTHKDINSKITALREKFNSKLGKNIETFLASFRYENADIIFNECVSETKKGELTTTDKADKIILNKWLSFPILFLIIFITYELSIVFGYHLTNYTWPVLAAIKNFIIDISPSADIARIPLITDMAVWLANSTIALLNYLPIFFILFALIAIMEDVGYMPRMAFILDKLFRKFGLHGQSTLPLVLGGAFVGGCAVPGVMSTKGISDDRARMATILTVPLMNCLAKVPFYTLLLGAFFPTQMSIMLFYISTVTVLAALLIAKLLTSTVLRTRETAPFVMELPPYHMPTFKGVILRSCERVWIYIKKVCTIVVAVAVILFVLLQFPGLSKEKQEHYTNEEQVLLASFDKVVKKSSYYSLVDSREEVASLLNFYDGYRAKKMSGSKGVDEKYQEDNPEFYKFLVPKNDKDAKLINGALRKLSTGRNKILREQKNDKIESSLLGMAGRALEPISQFAGFDWKINVAFLSSFAARESAVATLGSIYESNKDSSSIATVSDDSNTTSSTIADESSLRPEEMMAKNSGYTPLHAASIIIFMLLTPPCIATMIVVKMQTNSWAWMCFGIFFPFGLALAVASLFFTVSSIFGISGLEAISWYYFTLLFAVLVLWFLPEKRKNWSGGIVKNR
ncbi:MULTISPECIES: ferrous iron transport protein B [unclassified Campylobacter]|uniref:ferrous iron transport protein B n=1 Tax=unclassified Campylobacter TaxID=2593542 RepID=UPI0014741B6F|nr:ferrous iron transport protein B [Campylobacter sp. RM9328]MBE3021934.1 ferrous iron transport protein B [Campylobacter sp. 7477a]